LKGSCSAVSKPNFASKYALESSRRDLQNALLCTVLKAQYFVGKSLKMLPFFLPNVSNVVEIVKSLLDFVDFCADFYRNFTKSCIIKFNQ